MQYAYFNETKIIDTGAWNCFETHNN
jgi:hypothetical protein